MRKKIIFKFLKFTYTKLYRYNVTTCILWQLMDMHSQIVYKILCLIVTELRKDERMNVLCSIHTYNRNNNNDHKIFVI